MFSVNRLLHTGYRNKISVRSSKCYKIQTQSPLLLVVIVLCGLVLVEDVKATLEQGALVPAPLAAGHQFLVFRHAGGEACLLAVALLVHSKSFDRAFQRTLNTHCFNNNFSTLMFHHSFRSICPYLSFEWSSDSSGIKELKLW